MYIQQLKKRVLPPIQNNLLGCNEIALLILFYISFKLVTLPKITAAPAQVTGIFYITVRSKLINFCF